MKIANKLKALKYELVEQKEMMESGYRPSIEDFIEEKRNHITFVNCILNDLHLTASKNDVTFKDKINNVIDNLISEELNTANVRHASQFQTRHEAFAVMLEEVEEADNEMDDLKEGLFVDYWHYCKNDKDPECNPDNTIRLLNCMEAAVVCSIRELVQVGAMILKSKYLEERNDG